MGFKEAITLLLRALVQIASGELHNRRAEMSSGMRSNCTNAQLHIKSGKKIAVCSLPGSQICSFGGANPTGNRGLWMLAPAMVGTDLPPFVYSVVWFRCELAQTAFADHLIFAL